MVEVDSFSAIENGYSYFRKSYVGRQYPFELEFTCTLKYILKTVANVLWALPSSRLIGTLRNASILKDIRVSLISRTILSREQSIAANLLLE